MSTITNDATGNTPGELSEADRLAWLRIERALRGMRWWMLFLVLVATLIGLFLGVGFALAVASEPLSDAGRELLFIACLSSGSATGFALLLVALALARAYLTVRRLGNRVDISIVQRVFFASTKCVDRNGVLLNRVDVLCRNLVCHHLSHQVCLDFLSDARRRQLRYQSVRIRAT